MHIPIPAVDDKKNMELSPSPCPILRGLPGKKKKASTKKRLVAKGFG